MRVRRSVAQQVDMTSEHPSIERHDERARGEFEDELDDLAANEGELEDLGFVTEGTGAPPRRTAPPINWTFRSVLVTAALFAVVGYAVGYIVAKPRAPGETSVDVGFLRDMIDHHDQAVEMSLYTLASDANTITKTVAGDVLLSQRQEIGLMDGMLGNWGRDRGDPDRIAMEWMGERSPVAQMPGMQPRAEVLRLRTVGAGEIDRLFYTMMKAHHEGGVHMAEYAAEHAETKRARELAAFMANTQRTEIAEMNEALAKLDRG
jgi:uncharacterized protein (DUF305 family)